MRIEAVMFSALIVLITVSSATDYSSFIGVCPITKPDLCPALYDPVLGIPTFRIHSNACVACAQGAWFWIKWILSRLVPSLGTVSQTRTAFSIRSGDSECLGPKQVRNRE
jgi:hypothetical protein